MSVLNYEDLVEAFEAALVTKLRGHGAEAEYLEMWVPDDNPVKSILNMVEAAETFGRDEIAIQVADSTLDAAQRKELGGYLAEIGEAQMLPAEDGVLIKVSWT